MGATGFKIIDKDPIGDYVDVETPEGPKTYIIDFPGRNELDD